MTKLNSASSIRNVLRFIIPLGFFVYFTAACQAHPIVPIATFDASKLGMLERDVTYCTMDGVALGMDVYYPLTAEKPFPVVIYVHGGGWTEGTRNSVINVVDPRALQKAGFLMASVDYRLAPQYKFPAMIEDVKCAVRFLRAHAITYNIDPVKIGAIGDSAGGHLVALLGLTDEKAGFDVGEYLNYSSRVQAVVDLFGPADLTPQYARKLFFNPLKVFGTNDENSQIFLDASPVNYITSDAPPFLIFQGNLDTTVPPLQSQRLFKKLHQAGIPSELVMIKNAGHNLMQVGQNPINPSLEEIQAKIMTFLEKYLK